LKGYLDGSVKAAVLGEIKDAACIDIGEENLLGITGGPFL